MQSSTEISQVGEIAKEIFNRRESFQILDYNSDIEFTLKTICKYFGVSFKAELLCKDSLEKSITNLGLMVRPIELSSNWASNQFDVLIIHWSQNGLCAPVIRYSPTKIKFYETLGKNWCTDSTKLSGKIKNTALEISRGFPESVTSFRQMMCFALNHIWKRELLLVAALILLNFLVGLAIPFSMKLIFDQVILQGEKVAIIHIVALLATYFLSVTCFGLTSSLLEMRMEFRIYDRFQTAIWNKILSLQASFFKSMSTGDILQRLWNLEELRSVFSGIVAQTLMAIVFSPIYLIILFIMNWTLALIAVGFLVFAFLITSLIAIGVYKIRTIVANTESTTNSWALDILNSIRKIKLSATESIMLKKWTQVFVRKRKIKLRMQNLGNFHSSFIILVEGLTILVIFYFAFKEMFFVGKVGSMLAFLSLYTSFSVLMFGFTKTLLKIASTLPFFKRVSPIIQGVVETKNSDQIHFSTINEIRFVNVSFAYPGRDTNVLDNISLHIRKKQIVGISGLSGSGKSTFVRLLIGFETPTEGNIFLGDQNLSDLNKNLFRKTTGFIIQNSELFPGDILRNIIGFSNEYSQEDVWNALALAGVDREIRMMPMGIQTLINEYASGLSGGQKQRILIARAIIKKPSLFVLDEATNQIDLKTEKLILNNLKKLSATVIIISHRPETLVFCDKIVHFDNGRITEM